MRRFWQIYTSRQKRLSLNFKLYFQLTDFHLQCEIFGNSQVFGIIRLEAYFWRAIARQLETYGLLVVSQILNVIDLHFPDGIV